MLALSQMCHYFPRMAVKSQVYQRRSDTAHSHATTLPLTTLLKVLRTFNRRKCRYHRRFQQVPCCPFFRQGTVATFPLRIGTDPAFFVFHFAGIVASTNASTVGRELRLPGCLRKDFSKCLTSCRIVLPLLFNLSCRLIGNLADCCVRQLYPAEFVQMIGSEAIRSETATPAYKTTQAGGITAKPDRGWRQREGVFLAVSAVAVTAFEGDVSVGGD